MKRIKTQIVFLGVIMIAFFGLVSSCTKKNSAKSIVGLQPLGKVNTKLLDSIVIELERSGVFQCIVLPQTQMPSMAFVHIKTPRYRADKLLRYLKKNKPDSVQYIMGITSLDISTTKKDNLGNTLKPESKYEDWGVFGLGYKPGVASVVSIYRLKSKPSLLSERLQKVCLHELGHNLGLPHCDSQKDCVMSDAAESISTIDREAKQYCTSCVGKLRD